MERHQPMNMTVQFYHHMETIKVYFSVSIYEDTVWVCYHVAGSNESGFNFFQWLSVNLHLLQKKILNPRSLSTVNWKYFFLYNAARLV